MGYAIVATGRFAGLQEILPNEAADETGGLGEVGTKCLWNWVQPQSSDGILVQFWYCRTEKRREVRVGSSSKIGKCF